MKTIYLQIGSNIGDRNHYIDEAKKQIEKKIGKIHASSKIYETQAWGIRSQRDFLNVVIKVSTNFDPNKILKISQQIESDLGRIRKEKWGERCIDIDILFINNEIIKLKNLTVPHPHIQDRKFILRPLCDIASNLKHPIIKKDIKELLECCTDKLKVITYV